MTVTFPVGCCYLGRIVRARGADASRMFAAAENGAGPERVLEVVSFVGGAGIGSGTMSRRGDPCPARPAGVALGLQPEEEFVRADDARQHVLAPRPLLKERHPVPDAVVPGAAQQRLVGTP